MLEIIRNEMKDLKLRLKYMHSTLHLNKIMRNEKFAK